MQRVKDAQIEGTSSPRAVGQRVRSSRTLLNVSLRHASSIHAIGTIRFLLVASKFRPLGVTREQKSLNGVSLASVRSSGRKVR